MATDPIRRAKRGSMSKRLLVPMDPVMLGFLRQAALTEDVSVSEYVRRAVHDRLLRAAAKDRGPL